MKTEFLIAAPTSASGKTTIARGLMALLTKKGYRVQPFKCGPDYIDTKFHEAVCGRPSVNLDTFMAGEDHMRALYDHYGAEADVCIVEGMMGLYDGYDRDKGSSAEIASLLGLPVVLVINARSAAYSIAPLLQGFFKFRPEVRVAGVIFNQVGSARHYEMLRQVCNDLQIDCYGYLPKSTLLEQGSRYLGLDFSQRPETAELLRLLEEHVDWQQLLTLTCKADAPKAQHPYGQTQQPRHIMVARNDEAFSFIYQEWIDRSDSITFFDPETEVPQLDGTDLLYLPGGYPEKHAEALARNEACRQAIRDYAEHDGHILAECGGMMYLCQDIVTDESWFPMCGVLPCTVSARKADRKLSLGYRRFVLDGREYRGHEFHYSQFVGQVPPSACQVYNARGEAVSTPVFRYRQVLASYTHLYPYETDIHENR